jgi:tetratricopeptide (TPR) repeat protein
MNQAGNTAMLVVGALVAWGGYFAYRHWDRAAERPDSPVAVESATEKAETMKAAFAGGANVQDAEVEGFVTRLQQAVREGDRTAVTTMVAPGRMLDGVEAATGKSLPAGARAVLEAQLAAELFEFFDPTVVETEVKRIDRDAEGNLVVYLRMIDRDRIALKSRWWLYHDGEALRWWDGEDLQLGLRISTAMAAGIAAAEAQGGSDVIERFLEVITRLADMAMDDPVQVRQLAVDLDGLQLQGLPPSFRHLAIVARASAAAALGEPQDALARLDALETEALQAIDMPMRHYLRASACLALGRFADAAAAATRYLELLGGDAEAYLLLGMAELGRGDRTAALAAFDKGMADDPRLPDNYGGVAMASEELAAVVERLRRAPEGSVLDGAAQWLVDEQDAEALGRFLAAAAEARPDWDAGPWSSKAAGLGGAERAP